MRPNLDLANRYELTACVQLLNLGWRRGIDRADADRLFARGLERLGAGETATLTLAEPLTAAALGAIVLGERPGLAAAAGAGLVLAGLNLLALRPAKATPARAAVAPARPALEARA